MATWLMLAVIGINWLGALIVWGVGDRRPRLQHALASGATVLAGAASVALLPFAGDAETLRFPVGGIFGDFTLIPDGLGVFLAAVAAVVGSLAVIFSIDYMGGEAQLGRYYALVLLFIGAMAGLVLSGSLLFMFLFWEITAFCSYALISFHNDDPKAVTGGIKALIMTQVGGAGLLAGALLVYASLGTYDVQALLGQSASLPPGVLAAVAYGFLIAAAAKSAQVPFQTWLPGAMEAPTPISALIHAATMVNAGVYLLARFYPAFEGVPGWTMAVLIVGLVSALLAAIMALVANDLKCALAYSTISQLGYMVFAIGTGAIFASQFHLLSHAVFKALLFLGAGAVIHTVGTRDMRQMGGLGRQMPWVRAAFIIGAAALAGLPLANGFFSKELVLEVALEHGPLWAYILMLIGAGLTALYSLRMVSMVFYGVPLDPIHAHDAPAAMRVSLTALAAGTLTTWLLAGPFGELLAGTLPHHEVHAATTLDVVGEIVTAPATWIALWVVALGLALWFLRRWLAGVIRVLQPAARFAESGLGFDWLNTQIMAAVSGSAAALRATQTGYLSVNVAGIVGGLIILLAVLMIWGR
jgi:NADH-quinone oxidoreductase subunit L